jgi:hypothetical protein
MPVMPIRQKANESKKNRNSFPRRSVGGNFYWGISIRDFFYIHDYMVSEIRCHEFKKTLYNFSPYLVPRFYIGTIKGRVSLPSLLP